MSAAVCEHIQSVYRHCAQEVLKHKWIESQKAGYDLGEAAIKHWVQQHWTGYLRARWVEHLQGKQSWAELPECDFGLLLNKFQDRSNLLNSILDQLKAGKENLDVIWWSYEQQIPLDSVLEILEALNVNSIRLQHRFDPES
jgi:hypothetical protein